MSQENDHEKSNNEEKKKRRTRKDEEGRNFTCPCGKSYLSYPALYTHVKTKHQGKTPKENNGATSKVQADQQHQTKQPISQIKQILDKYFSGDQTSAYLTPLSHQDNQYIKQIMGNWEQVKETRLEDPSNNQNQTINKIFARFLTQLKNQVKSQAFTYLCEFVCFFHKRIVQEKKDKDFCRDNSGMQLPHFFNDFILKRRASGFESKKGSPLNNLTLACKMLYYFGSWLFQQRYTNFSVKFNSISS